MPALHLRSEPLVGGETITTRDNAEQPNSLTPIARYRSPNMEKTMRCMLLLAALVIAGCRPTVTLTEAQRILQKQQAELNRLESNRNELKYELEQNKLVPGISRKEYVEQIERLTELIEHQQKRVDNAQALVDRLSPNLD